jgi:hypothetical protein
LAAYQLLSDATLLAKLTPDVQQDKLKRITGKKDRQNTHFEHIANKLCSYIPFTISSIYSVK